MEYAPIVSLTGVSLYYQEPHAETEAVADLTFQMFSGELLAIVGPSGCGKTTVLSLLTGLIPPSSGTVEIMGEAPGNARHVGYMLQRDHLFEWRTVEENVLLGLEVKRLLTKERREAADSLIARYGLNAFRRHYPAQLSGGMRQKVALIRTLAFDPPLLLLDEPFSALDYQTRLRLADEMVDIIRREKKTAILVTHDIAEAVSCADRVLVFSDRPARVAFSHRIDLPRDIAPFARRQISAFQTYFNTIWKELDVHGTQANSV